MDKVTIISHLTPLEWKLSWNDKVVEDTRENQKQTQSQTCFWGHFSNDKDFTICHHKEFEIKGMSFGMYFNGHLEWDEQGSKITGNFGKKWSANLFLIAGVILCILVMVGAPNASENSLQIFAVAAVLLVILMVFYFSKPRRGQERILEQLKKISFDDKFSGKDHKRSKGVTSSKKKKKRSMKEMAASVADVDKKAAKEADGEGEAETGDAQESAFASETSDARETAADSEPVDAGNATAGSDSEE